MKILLLCNKSPWPPKDGGASATLNIIKSLLACQASVTVLALNTSRHFVEKNDIPDEILKSTDYNLIKIDSGIKPLKLFLNLILSEKPYNIQRFWSSKYNLELVKILGRGFDIVQIESLSMHIYLNTIRQNTPAPVVFRPHNVENHIWLQLAAQEKNLFKKSYFRILAGRLLKVEKNIINRFEAILPISPTDQAWFKSEGLSIPSFLIVPGYNPAELIVHDQVNAGEVFFIGALDWLPNIHGLNWFIKEVWPVVVRIKPETRFIIAGRNASKRTITKFKGHNIVYEGEVESSADFMKEKNIMVVPLFSGSGIRMKIIEGMSLGKCIVTTPVGAEGITCTDKKDIFISGSPAGFAELILELLSNPNLRSETGKNAIKNVIENYNILASSDNLMNFYRELTA